MSDYKLHTPNGVNDILSGEYSIKKEIEDKIRSVFSSMGYMGVETPMFEYYDCYAGRSGQISQENLYKFFDEQGRVLALRPDFTTSIARMAATKENGKGMPLRYMYTGSVFRAEHTEGARRREFTQSGIELIGSCAAAADAEVIAAAIEALLSSGIKELTMEIGQVAFFNGLAGQTGLDAANAEKLRERIDSKDVVGIRDILKNLTMENEIKELIEELPYLFGDISIIDKARVQCLNETSKIALDNLRDIYNLLCAYGFRKYISIDLGMLQSIDYYTGSIFKAYTYDVGFPVCAGGRYDRLMSNFGEPKGAVGAAIGINRVMSAVKRESAKEAPVLVFADKGMESEAYKVSLKLRARGDIAEGYINGGDFSDAEAFAKARGISEIVRVRTDRKTEIYEINTGKKSEMPTESFLTVDEED